MGVGFKQLREVLASKAPRSLAQMAHYHHCRDELELAGTQLESAYRAFCMVECIQPPPSHPTEPTSLCMEFHMEIGCGNITRFWMDEGGELTDVGAEARQISKAWHYDRELRAELRNLALQGIYQCKNIAYKMGVPKALRIHDNLPVP